MGAPALSSEACPCGAPYVQGAKFCSECGAKRPVQESNELSAQRQFREEAPPRPEERRRETSEEARKREERRQVRREEKKRKREERARQRESLEGDHPDDEAEEAGSSDADERERRPLKDGQISTKLMDDSMRRFWG